MSNLLSLKSIRVEVCRGGSCWSLTIEYVVSRAWYIGCALGLQPREEISIISVRSKVSADVAHWLGFGLPVRRTESDSLHPLHVSRAGVAQVEERRSRKAEAGVSITPSGSRITRFVKIAAFSMRASEPVSCWPHKPREWRSTRQPATSL
jgi:hypothetical protein